MSEKYKLTEEEINNLVSILKGDNYTMPIDYHIVSYLRGIADMMGDHGKQLSYFIDTIQEVATFVVYLEKT